MSVVQHPRSRIPQNLALDHGITHKIAESRSWRDIFFPRGARSAEAIVGRRRNTMEEDDRENEQEPEDEVDYE